MSDQQPAAVSVRNVGMKRGTRWILRGVTWTVPAGTCAAILGPNGSGKSTLSRVLSGHLWPTSGSVDVLGEHFGSVDLAELRRRIRLVQAAGPYDVDPSLTTREVVLTGFFGTLALYDMDAMTPTMRSRAQDLLARVGLRRVSEQPYSTLSSGERVRSLIARALASEPDLLLLDEPTAGLDLLAREQVLATVQAIVDPPAGGPRTSVILVTHHVGELPPATSRILLLDEGSVAAEGTPEQVLQPEVLSRVYGVPLDVGRTHGRYSVHVKPGGWRDLLDPGR
jgi:iron complex transport system ATP-binding protein